MTKEQQIPAAVLRRDDEGGPLPQMVAQHREQLRQEREATPSSKTSLDRCLKFLRGFGGAHEDWVVEIEALQRNLALRNEQIDGYERQLGIDQAGAERTIGSELERLCNVTDVLKTVYRLAAGHATECQCRQCEIFELLEPIVGNTSPRSAHETTDVLKTIYRLAGGHAIECQCRQCEIFELLEPIVGNSSRSAVDPPVAHKHWCAKLAPSVYTAMDCNCGAVKPIAPTDHVHSWDGDKCHYCQFPKRSYLALECERLAALAKDFDGFTSDTLQTLVARNRSAEKATEPLPTCQHDLLQPNTTIAVDPADPFHAWCTVCKHDFRTRAPLNDGGERCANWPCQLINGHAGPCASSPENGKEGQS